MLAKSSLVCHETEFFGCNDQVFHYSRYKEPPKIPLEVKIATLPVAWRIYWRTWEDPNSIDDEWAEKSCFIICCWFIVPWLEMVMWLQSQRNQNQKSLILQPSPHLTGDEEPMKWSRKWVMKPSMDPIFFNKMFELTGSGKGLAQHQMQALIGELVKIRLEPVKNTGREFMKGFREVMAENANRFQTHFWVSQFSIVLISANTNPCLMWMYQASDTWMKCWLEEEHGSRQNEKKREAKLQPRKKSKLNRRRRSNTQMDTY